jgi:hypothetical protein
MALSRRTVLVLAMGAVAASVAGVGVGALVAEPGTPRRTRPGAEPLGSLVFPVPVEGTVVEVAPGGVQAAIDAAPPGRLTVIATAGSYADVVTVPRGKQVTIQPRSYPSLGRSDVVWFDGQGRIARQITASDSLTLLGIGTRHHAGDWESDTSRTDSLHAPIYFGGSSPGRMEQCHITSTAANGFSFIVPMTIRHVTVEDVGHTGFFGTTAHDSVVEHVLVRRYNAQGRAPEPESAAFKLTRTRGATVRDIWIEDGNGAHGLWLDVSCTDFEVVSAVVAGAEVDGRLPIKTGLNLELSERGVVVDAQVTGTSAAGIVCLDTGHVRIWSSDLRGNNAGLLLLKSDRFNDGEAPNGSAADVPWVTSAIEVGNCDFDGRIPLVSYDDGAREYLGASFVHYLGGCTFASSGPEFGALGGDRQGFDSEAALRAVPADYGGPLGSRLGPVYFGTDPDEVARTRVPLPADVETLLGT